uniref:Secretory calcium-binding phosphoprotein proline-glutamine rich 1 n=1 Tax=Chinchilla lanigera TaxID=34839 RepID=A0A8C2UX29_CHILA
MKCLIFAGLLSAACALPVPLDQSGGSSSAQRFNFYPSQVPPVFPQTLFPQLPQPPLIPIPLPLPYNPNQVLTPNDLLTLITSILNQLRGFVGK